MFAHSVYFVCLSSVYEAACVNKNGPKSLLLQCKTLIGHKFHFCKTYCREVCVQHGVFGYGRSNGVTAIFVA